MAISQVAAGSIMTLPLPWTLGSRPLSVCHETAKLSPKRTASKAVVWVIPSQQNAAFVCQMESVLAVYPRRYHRDLPVLCLDEAMKRSMKETIEPLLAQPGQPPRQNYQYERHGTANLFMICKSIVGWHHVEVPRQGTAVE